MIQIYCLVDPRNDKPFYIGATKVLLKHRLSGHISDALSSHQNKYTARFKADKKHALIKDLLRQDIRPRIDHLYTCTIHSVDYYELFFYQLISGQGFELFNSYLSFDYPKYRKIPYYNFSENT